MSQIKVMRQALKALDSLFDWQVDEGRGQRCIVAANALRQAIEQAEAAEPVGTVVEDGDDFGRVKALLDQVARVQLAVGTQIYTHPPTAPDADNTTCNPH